MVLLSMVLKYTNTPLFPLHTYTQTINTVQADILDSALLRPGRFDRRVQVDVPDFNGRVAVLKVHARGKPLSPDVDLESIARRTPGFSGAQLQNLLNEAAIFAARQKKTVITWEDVDNAVDRLLVGLEKKNAQTSEKMREIVAYHEAGVCAV
jgi:cell division protease FtsH